LLLSCTSEPCSNCIDQLVDMETGWYALQSQDRERRWIVVWCREPAYKWRQGEVVPVVTAAGRHRDPLLHRLQPELLRPFHDKLRGPPLTRHVCATRFLQLSQPSTAAYAATGDAAATTTTTTTTTFCFIGLHWSTRLGGRKDIRPVALISEGSVLEWVDEENQWEPTNPLSREKRPLKRGCWWWWWWWPSFLMLLRTGLSLTKESLCITEAGFHRL